MNTDHLKHNIFGYATKELSQDAFIAWLLSYAYSGAENENPDLWACAQSFLRSFVGKEDETTFTVTDIEMQRDKIDVYVEMTDQQGKQYAVIIEDKVYSAHHDDQIYRYTEKVQNKLTSDSEIHAVYFKTGHIEDTEKIEIRRMKENGVILHEMPLDSIVSLLDSASSNSDIFNMYKEYIFHMAEDRAFLKEKAASDGFYSNASTNYLNDAYAQWCFMDKIFPERKMEDDHGMQESFHEWKETHGKYHGDQPLFAQDYMYSGSSSGRPWTQYCFWEAVHKKEESADENRPKHHSLFWRLDPEQISLRYYVNSGLTHPEDDGMLKEFREISKKVGSSGFSGWRILGTSKSNTKYEFSLLEHKFSPNDNFDDLQTQIRAIHQDFKDDLPSVLQKND